MEISTLPAAQAGVLLPLLHQVHALHVAAQPEIYPPLTDDAAAEAFLRSWMEAEETTALVSRRGEIVVGYLIYQIEKRAGNVLRKPDVFGMLHHISVDAAHRRGGIGMALIGEMRSRLAAMGIERLRTS